MPLPPSLRRWTTKKKSSTIEAALALLAQRDRFSYEIRAALAGHDPDEVEKVVADLERRKMLDDERVGQNLIESQVHSGYGNVRIVAAFEARGAVAPALPDESSRIRALLAKRYPHRNPADRRRAQRWLAGRGFSEDAVSDAAAYFGDELD